MYAQIIELGESLMATQNASKKVGHRCCQQICMCEIVNLLMKITFLTGIPFTGYLITGLPLTKLYLSLA